MLSSFDASIDFSAQFGGKDAADAVLPQFRALKAAAKGIVIAGFPVRKLAFILRVDGCVNAYGLDGLGHPDVDHPEYVSLDIGLPSHSYDGPNAELMVRISEHLQAAPDYLRDLDDRRLAGLPHDALRAAMGQLTEAYEGMPDAL